MRRLSVFGDEGLELGEPGRPSAWRPIVELLRGEGPIEPRSAALERFAPGELIGAALATFGRGAAVSTAFGAGGLCVMHLAQAHDPDVRAFFIDTGFNFPETEGLLGRWVTERRLNLLRVLPELTPEEQDERHGRELWRRDPDLCCRIRKVEPNHRALEDVSLWIAALRRDESSSRVSTPILQELELPSGRRILKLCPIARWTKREVWRYILEHELPYNPLHDRGFPSVGCTHCTRAVRPGEDERAGRWAGSSKQECGLHLTWKDTTDPLGADPAQGRPHSR